MRLKDINAAITFELWMKPELSGETLSMGVGYISSSDEAYRLRINDQQWDVLLREPSVGMDLNFHLKRGYAHLAEVLQIAKDGSALVKIVFFNGKIVEIGDVEIGIDEHIETTAKRNGIRFNGTEDLGKLLSEKCSLRVGGKTFFIMLAGRSSYIDFDDKGDGEETNNLIDEKYRCFSIQGDRLKIPVYKKQISRFEEIYLASKILFRDTNDKDGAICLAHGNIKFLSLHERISAINSSEMARLTQDAGSYLRKWDEYGRKEGELFLKKARAIGVIEYDRYEPSQDGRTVKFFINNPPPKELELSDKIELTDKVPVYISNPYMSWNDYSSIIEKEFKENPGEKLKSLGAENNTWVKIVGISISEKSIELELDTIPQKPYLVWSTKGEQTQIERRMKARAAILTGRSANPELGLLIEENGIPSGTRRVIKLKPLTPFVREKIFKHDPTPKQIEAIDIALNTPDIALIQGPPGTGKTTVITAILERLNEEYDKTKSIKGQVLVSGFQHDAVENIVARLSINALPPIKFGKRASDSEFAKDAVTEKINKWCSNVAENIRSKNSLAQTEEQIRLRELFGTYSLCPSKYNTVNLMKRILDLPRDVITDELVSEAKEIINSLQTEQKPKDFFTLRLIRALRVSDAAFEDDGPARAFDLLNKLEDEPDNPDLSVLEEAARWRSGKPLCFLPKLRELKKSLLYKYLPSPDFGIEKPREDVLKLVATVSRLLEKKFNSTNNKRDAVLAEFLHELENNPDGVREAIEEYTFVYAATTQQAVGEDIRRAKNKNRDEQSREMVKYDTVIIDEAARTSPRDLLIPMSQAEKRIILVGDHRQLPHLIDEEVARALESDNPSDSSIDADFKKSMFGYLFDRLKKLEEKDGIKRTVTLDAQYRTHPLLGNFCSANFYEEYGEGYKSPLGADNFTQQLPDIAGKAAVWIDVPNSQGEESRDGTGSRYRDAEARVIADYISKWICSKEAAELSFGIISFYRAQVNAVYKTLEEYRITKQEQDGTWQICQEYRILKNGKERLRIGTVDAFQGMEFDIVFLSMVRSQDMNALPPRIRNEENYEKKQQTLFGHLMSKNRLCVSMSRQKKVLAIVGDGVFANTPIAGDAVPALKKFYELCREKGVIL